jgi:hypothetical protein
MVFSNTGSSCQENRNSQRFLLEQCVVDWRKKRRSQRRKPKKNTPRVQQDKRVVRSLTVAASESDHPLAARIATSIAACCSLRGAGASRSALKPCRLWVCSRCHSARSDLQREQVLDRFLRLSPGSLSIFTALFAAVGFDGDLSSPTDLAQTTRKLITRMRNGARRSGIDLGYYGQVELKIIRREDIDEHPYFGTTIRDMNAAALNYPVILIAHVHGVIRGPVDLVHDFLHRLFSASRQVKVETLRDRLHGVNLTVKEALSIWCEYFSECEIRTGERRQEDKGKWLPDAYTGPELSAKCVFQLVLKHRYGRFAHRLEVPEVDLDKLSYNELCELSSYQTDRLSDCRDAHVRQQQIGVYRLILNEIAERKRFLY